MPLTLGRALAVLRGRHGRPERPPTSDPFELILLENVAYLAPPERRREAFEELWRTVGTRPADILAAPRAALVAVASKGILAATFAKKLRECARIAADDFDGDLDAVTRLPLPAARRALRSFPGIGEPGAEKILLFTGRQRLLAPDSNGLRVLVRLGLVREGSSYARTYAAAREAARRLPADLRRVQEAHLLLQAHGRTLCRDKTPLCEQCPLARACPHARRLGKSPVARPSRVGKRRLLPRPVVAAVDASRILGVRAGARSRHRFVGVWPVVVNGRVFARSWFRRPEGWYETFRHDPLGTLQVGEREVPIRAIPCRSERLRDAVEQAYASKYPTPGARGYVRGFRSQRRRETTTEFVRR